MGAPGEPSVGNRLSIIIPSHDGVDLDRALASVTPQLADGDEVLVVHDCHGTDDLPDWLPWLVPGVRVMGHDAGYHMHGHPQRTYAATMATGDYLLHIDDDDILLPGALACVRATIAQLPEPRPLLFQFISPTGHLVWWRQGVIQPGYVGATGFVAPNIPDRLGTWGDRYMGDFDYIVRTLARWPGGEQSLAWAREIIAVCRPEVQTLALAGEPVSASDWPWLGERARELTIAYKELVV